MKAKDKIPSKRISIVSIKMVREAIVLFTFHLIAQMLPQSQPVHSTYFALVIRILLLIQDNFLLKKCQI